MDTTIERRIFVVYSYILYLVFNLYLFKIFISRSSLFILSEINIYRNYRSHSRLNPFSKRLGRV